MANSKHKTVSRRDFLTASVGAVVVAGVGCGSSDKSNANTGTVGGTGNGVTGGTGGSETSAASSTVQGGTSTATGGGGNITGGTSATGNSNVSTGGNATGGTNAAGGSASAGGSDTGGSKVGTGGAQAGGTSAKATTGKATGGTKATGGAGAGGQASGGVATSGGTSAANTGEKPLVCLARNTDVNAAVKQAIARVGGIPDLTGKVVVIRPNAIPTDGPPYNTNPDVVKAVIQAVKAAGSPKSITVCDDAYQGDLTASLRANGLAAAATAEGATAMDMKGSGTSTVNPTGATNWTSGITFYNMILDADYIINVPVCKSHSYAGFTMAMKAWYGNQVNYRNTHPNNLSAALAELHLAKKEDLVILDATKALLNGGPFKGDGDVVASPGIIVASSDAIAADVTGICIMKHYIKQMGATNNQITNQTVWKQGVIARAQQLTQLGWITGKTFPYEAIGIDEAATIMGYRDA